MIIRVSLYSFSGNSSYHILCNSSCVKIISDPRTARSGNRSVRIGPKISIFIWFQSGEVRVFNFLLAPSVLVLFWFWSGPSILSVLPRSGPGFPNFCSALFLSGLVQSGTVRFWTVDPDDKNSSHQILPMEFLPSISPMEFILEIFIHNKISKHVTKL